MKCSKCSKEYSYAEANQADGSLVCYECRTQYGIEVYEAPAAIVAPKKASKEYSPEGIENASEQALIALGKFLELADLDDIDDEGNNRYSYGSNEYLVLDDAEADEACAEHITETVWTFKASFLSAYMHSDITESVIKKLQEECSEGANEAFIQLIEANSSMGPFIERAIDLDGRGHFLNCYDGEENEEDNYFIYRVS